MRRTLAGLLLGMAFLCAGLSLSCWMLQRSAFDPGRTEELAYVILEDDDIRADLATRVGNAAAAQMSDKFTVEQLRAFVDDNLATGEGAVLFSGVLSDAHARLIGERDQPVQITGRQMADIVRDDRAAVLPPVSLDVPRVGVLATTRSIVDILVPSCALAGLLFAVIGFATHPERGALTRSLAVGLVAFAVFITLLGYVLPRFVIPALSSNPWANAPSHIAQRSLPTIVLIDIVLIGIAAALVLVTATLGRRRRWTAPVSGYRSSYNDQRRWS
jgi:hypothetical protein